MLKIGHRGAAGHAPENTLLSAETAISMGVDVVEIDIRLSRDGQLIVMHDERDLTLEQAQALGLPTLREVLLTVQGRAALMADIKVRNIILDVAALAADVAPGIAIYYASFLHTELLRLREIDPAATTIALIDAVPVFPAAFAVDAKATYAGVAFDCLEPGFVDALRNSGIGIFTYTVDDPRDIAYAISLGVDGVISNFPDRLSKV